MNGLPLPLQLIEAGLGLLVLFIWNVAASHYESKELTVFGVLNNTLEYLDCFCVFTVLNM